METRLGALKIEKESSFLPYLWGMETMHFMVSSVNEIPSFYLTYEEWKRQGIVKEAEPPE